MKVYLHSIGIFFVAIVAAALAAETTDGVADILPSSKPTASKNTEPATTESPKFDTLAGNLPGVILGKKRPYLVVSDIYVPQGKRVGIDAGVVLLFKNFTTLHVLGTLSVRGTKEQPVVFTSVNDTAYNPTSTVDPAPFDWNGIYIHEDGVGSEFNYCAVLYSVEGINSKTRFIRLNPCLFLHNGRSNLTIEGTSHEVTDKPYYYSLTIDDSSLKNIPLSVLSDPRAPLRNSLRYSGLGVTALGAALGIVYADRYGASLRRFQKLSSCTIENLISNSGEVWERAQREKNGHAAWMLIFFSLAAAGLASLGWSFAF